MEAYVKTRPILLAALLLASAAPLLAADVSGQKSADESAGKPPPQAVSGAGGQVHTVVGGDTLWGLSGQFFNSPSDWPRLWSYNPQIRNPHWIYPGEKINLAMPPRESAPGPVEREIKLVVEKVSPPQAGAGGGSQSSIAASGGVGGKGGQAEGVASSPAMADGSAGVAASSGQGGPAGRTVAVNAGSAQDYVASERPLRLGSIDNSSIGRNFAGQGEEVRITPRTGVSLKEGERLTIFDDSREVKDPSTGKTAGRHVRVVGEAQVVRVSSDAVWARVLSAREPVEDGQGVIPPVQQIREVREDKPAKALTGSILAGFREIEMFSQGDVIFLNKGGDDGVAPGVYVDIPVQDSAVNVRGYSEDQKKPLARAVVVSTQPKSSTALITQSRWGVSTGMRFVSLADSP